MDFFSKMDPALQTYWYIAIPVSLIFIIQAIMTFVGLDSGDGLEADFDGDMDGGDEAFQLFSFRNLVNFLLGLSWGGISFYKLIENKLVLGLVAFAIGAAFLIVFFLIMRQLKKLEEDNTFTVQMALDRTGDVYLKIPAEKSGSGIIQVSVQGSVREIKAVTEGEEIPSGAMIRVIAILSQDLVVVEKL